MQEFTFQVSPRFTDTSNIHARGPCLAIIYGGDMWIACRHRAGWLAAPPANFVYYVLHWLGQCSQATG